MAAPPAESTFPQAAALMPNAAMALTAIVFLTVSLTLICFFIISSIFEPFFFGSLLSIISVSV